MNAVYNIYHSEALPLCFKFLCTINFTVILVK